jgi:hypothetical protein
MKAALQATLASLVFTSALLAGNAQAAEKWFVLGQATLSAANPSVTIKSEGGRWHKDVKQVKLSAEGGDVAVSQVVYGWDNRPDETKTDVGTIKAGGETAPTDAPGRKGRLKTTTINYTLPAGVTSATVKVWGYD